MTTASEWQIYRTRFLIRARQLTEPLTFTDALGREHRGIPVDYLVESSDGMRRIAPRQLFEDVSVAMGPAEEDWCPFSSRRVRDSAFIRGAPSPIALA